MLAGEQGTGKTTLARYLVGKRPTRFRISTDGIELYNGLSYMDRESKDWLGGLQDFSLEEILISRSLLKEEKITKQNKLDDTTQTSQDIPVGAQIISLPESSRNLRRESKDTFISDTAREWSEHDDFRHTSYLSNDGDRINDKPIDDSDGSEEKSSLSGEMHVHTVTKPGVIGRLKNMFGVSKQVKEVKVSISQEKFLKMSSKVGAKQLHNKKIAPIIIWDFGGQDVFYSTHQTFLTYRAIYMVVLDGSRKLDDPCPYEKYLPGKGQHKTARDYLLFWINTIVTYCKGSNQGFPKIMVVLTHKDQVKAHDVEKRRHEIFAEIKKMFQQTPLEHHLVIEDHIFVNAKDENDREMGKIKKIIMSESERQPTWGELLPKCFIPLELEFASLIRRNIPLITLEHLQKINTLQPIRPLSKDELKVFLKFQHSIGKLLYFDEPKLDDRIILSPTLLIDAFKSIVTDKQFCKGDRKREDIWDAMGTKGVVSKYAIDDVWKRKKYAKFNKDKDYLLTVMTHLDILVEPKRYDTRRMRIPADFYYVASMVRGSDDSRYLHSADITQRNIAIAFQSTSLMIPPALSFRFISYCLSVWAVKTYGGTNNDMLFHRSGVFTIDPSLDMYILCEDDKISVRLVHARTNALIMRDLASSINECLTSALEKISQLYIRTSSDQSHTSDASFVTNACCNSPDTTCILPFKNLTYLDKIWKCPSHGIEHNIHLIKSWIPGKEEDRCDPGCPVTNDEFLKELPSDLHLRRLSLMYSSNDVRDLAIHLGLSATDVNMTVDTGDQALWNFEVFRRCRDSHAVTFKEIKRAIAAAGKGNIHTLCKLVKGDFIGYDREPEKWDVVPTEEHIDRLVPLVGNKSLQFLIELGMDFHTWERISHKQIERDLVRLNKDILEEWSSKFCRMHSLKPTLRTIAQSFSNIGKNVKIVENALLDLF
ncbi:Hypothetical predicted protein [Mytilus galloprovincialis]|uniref:COR domain-containing protein n=1 Tax=Mytilus galloprovincialis TaxID=29158 RepID=A0A8B6D701_MYTGA|nr:Hypothetical predicted protein [Mytilus galloprovincialis]